MSGSASRKSCALTPNIRSGELLPTKNFYERNTPTRFAQFLAPVNSGYVITNGTITLSNFIEQQYCVRCEQRIAVPAGNVLHMERSTVDGYRDIYDKHVEPSPIAKMKVQAITPSIAQNFVESLNQDLSHQTHMRIKNFLSGVMSWPS